MGSYSLLDTNRPILMFDTQCLLCNRSVKFLLKIDSENKLLFTGLTSKIGKRILDMNAISADSVVLYYNQKCYIKSNAVLVVLRVVGFPYSLASFAYIIPVFIRDWIYDIIAKHRLQWFGITNKCIIDNSNYADRIID